MVSSFCRVAGVSSTPFAGTAARTSASRAFKASVAVEAAAAASARLRSRILKGTSPFGDAHKRTSGGPSTFHASSDGSLLVWDVALAASAAGRNPLRTQRCSTLVGGGPTPLDFMVFSLTPARKPLCRVPFERRG